MPVVRFYAELQVVRIRSRQKHIDVVIRLNNHRLTAAKPLPYAVRNVADVGRVTDEGALTAAAVKLDAITDAHLTVVGRQERADAKIAYLLTKQGRMNAHTLARITRKI